MIADLNAAMVVYAAGVLPITRTAEGRVLFLVGKDVRDMLWSDFGGKCERVDRGDPMNTAAREFYEETLGCVTSQWGLRQRMKAKNFVLLRGVTQNGFPYWMYVMEVPYVSPKTFVKVVAFLKHKSLDPELVEKTELKWLDFESLMISKKRHVFENTVSRNRDVLLKIATEPWNAVRECGGTDNHA